MAEKYGFFNSMNGDRLYNAEDIGGYFTKLVSDGVFQAPATNLKIVESSGMTVNVSAGWGFIACHWLNNTAAKAITLNGANPSLNRIDRIVLRLDRANRRMELGVINGTPAGTPTAPDLTRTSNGVYELSLAQVRVSAGVTAITQADIMDEREDASVCGYVTSLLSGSGSEEVYAYDEAIVGQWVDGSTVYKKTVHVTNLSSDAHYDFEPPTGYIYTALIKFEVMTTFVDHTYNFQYAGTVGNDRASNLGVLNRSTGAITVGFYNPTPITEAWITFYYTKQLTS